jgi:CubicO group peptidase (beta-lactamase class C family)
MIASPRLLTLSLLCFSAAQTAILAAQTPTNSATPTTTQQRIDSIQSCLTPPVIVKGDAPDCSTLAKRMADLHVPGVSIAVVHNGIIEWARGFGVEQQGGKPVTPDTLFQAGSISKPLASMAALHQVQLGKLSLDSDVNQLLTSWKIPPSPTAPNATVTLRELLTHTAGLTVHGFPGYAADAPVPTLVQVLNGEKLANTPAIRLESVPGEKWNYSGGGYTIMQQLVIDVTKEPFAKLLQDTVLSPIGMTHSTYQQPLPTALQPNAATPYAADGTAIPGGAHTYVELAAAGLWTTPSDLARYIIENQQSLLGKANHVLSQQLTQQMVTPGKGNWGLGLQIGGAPSNQYFSHGGVNEGFESIVVGYEHNGEGAVVMTNAQGGLRLIDDIIRSIAVAYDWPNFRPPVRTLTKVDPAILARYVGTYELTPTFSITITLEGDQLMTEATHQHKHPLFPESNTKFFLKVVDAETEFFIDDKGQATYMVLHQNGQEIKGTKK